MSGPGKYAGPGRRTSEMFASGDGRYGYRRIRLDPRREGVRVSEKAVARLMRELGLVAKRGRKRRRSSCKGETSDAPENLAKRNFHADAPSKLRLTGITESRIPAGKVCLSPAVDCFDGMVVSWAMPTSPDNGACGGSFERLKVELLYGRSWSGWDVDDFMGSVDRCIHWHNERRIKESLGGMSPLQYRRSLNLAA